MQPLISETQCAFQFLIDQCTPSSSEVFRLLCVSLYCSFSMKGAWRLGRTIGLGIVLIYPVWFANFSVSWQLQLYWSWQFPLCSVSLKSIKSLIALNIIDIASVLQWPFQLASFNSLRQCQVTLVQLNKHRYLSFVNQLLSGCQLQIWHFAGFLCAPVPFVVQKLFFFFF